MSIFIKEMIKNKLKHVTSDELLQYSKQYGFQLTKAQTEQIAFYLRRNTLDPFDLKTRHEMFKRLAVITDEQTAKNAEQLLDTLIRSYGLDHLFK